MTNTETSMREMRLIVTLFSKSNNFDEQWILFNAYLNTLHSLSDNDNVAKTNFHQNELINFALVLRNVMHHQPAKWHFGKHDVHPTSLSFNFSQNERGFSTKLSLVIQKKTLEEEELQQILGAKSSKQLTVLCESLEKIINSHVIIVFSLMQQNQAHVEQYCKNKDQYTERYDNEPNSYIIINNA